MIAEVIIESSVKQLNKIFDYEIPDGMNVKIGSRVLVPFGNSKQAADAICIRYKK